MLPYPQERVFSLLTVTQPFARPLSFSIGAVLFLGVAGHSPVLANDPLSREVTSPAPSLDAITQNTPGYSEGFPAGVPKTYAWCNGSYKPPGNGVPPSDFTAVTALSLVYPKFGATEYSNPDAKIIVTNARTYVHLRTTKEWVLVQDQSEDEIAGGHFGSNASRNTGFAMKVET